MGTTVPEHWADRAAKRIIQDRGDRGVYVLASGITPSGTVHFGNFREVITVDLVARALRSRGKKVRFLFSWDEFDTFRKIPANMPKELESFLYQPLVDVPDPEGRESSYAASHEKKFERELGDVGIETMALYQAQKYRGGEYGQLIVTALSKREAISAILNGHRKDPLPPDYLPVGVYCRECNRDHGITEKSWDGKCLHYFCQNCNHRGQEDPLESRHLKLPWRVDWPMRWAKEGVDFESGGKDHSSEGGSFSTAKEIVKLFGADPPVYLQYDFVSIRGSGGKMSSSLGNTVTLGEVLRVTNPR